MPNIKYETGLHSILLSGSRVAHLNFTDLFYFQLKGCEDFRFRNRELGLFENKQHFRSILLQIAATVTEDATGVSRNASSVTVNVVRHSVTLRFTSDTPRHLKPGLPFQGRVSTF